MISIEPKYYGKTTSEKSVFEGETILAFVDSQVN